MTHADGLLASAALYAAALVLIAIGYRISREIVRTPAALLAIVTAAMGSFLLVKHAPAGAEWQPMSWTPSDPAPGPSKRLSFPLRQRSLTDGADYSGGSGSGRFDLNAKGGSGAGGGEAADAGQGAGGGGGLFSRLFAPAALRTPAAGDVTKDCPHCPEIVIVPGGRFVMGAGETDAAATHAEKPAGQVSIWPGFAIGRYEVTIGEFEHFANATGRAMPSCPGRRETTGSDRLPIACVSWKDAAAYAAWLRRITGKPYRLPSAAEWEYAAKAEGADLKAAAQAGMSAGLARVETTAANAWSIHGMSGNLAEIVADCWRPSLDAYMPDPERGCAASMLKDGAWMGPEIWRRPSARRPLDTAATSQAIGFRIARDLR